MALINCKVCGGEVSDKAVTCLHCGSAIVPEKNDEPQMIVCEDCGTEFAKTETSCPKCGCPVESEKESEVEPQKVEIAKVNLPTINKNKKRKIIIAVIAVIVLAFGATFCVINISKTKKENAIASYGDTLTNTCYTMLSGAADAESAGNLIKSVWYDTIHEEYDSETYEYTHNRYGSYYDDFNDALAELFSDETFKEKLSGIEANQTIVNSNMKKLLNPPEEYAEAYSAMKDFYNAYLDLTNLVLNPSGSLNTFSSNFNNADSKAVNCYEAMKLYIE